MALGLIGLVDLSIVTDRLVELLRAWRDASEIWTPPGPPFNINVTGAAPDSVRGSTDCQLSLYLFHVSVDKFQRNSPVIPQPPAPPPPHPRVPTIPFQPLSLDLYYLLTAHAADDYVREQQAMSIALKCFHENPIVRTTVMFGATPVQEEFTLTMEVQTADELSRIWQATTVPARLAACYKVSVVFISPEAPTVAAAPPVERISLAVNPTSLPASAAGHVIGTLRQVSYRAPDPPGPPPPQPDIRHFDQSPVTVAAGQQFLLLGAGLDQPTAKRVYLLMPDGTEHEVTSWVVPNPIPPLPPVNTSSRLLMQLPAAVGAPPAQTPPAGVYQLRVGSDTGAGDLQTYRSNATPFSVAALATPPAGQSVLTPAGATFTVNGVGFIAGQTEVLLGTIHLSETGGALNPGEFNINAAGTVLTFQLPPGLAAGLYDVRVRVNNVESAPTWWVRV